MSTETPGESGTGQAPTTDATQTDQAPAANPPSDPQQTQTAETTDAPQITLEQALAKLQELEKSLTETRKEAAAHRVKAKELDKLREEAETAKLSDVEKAQKRAETAEAKLTQYQQRLAKVAVEQAAQRLNIVDPEVAHTLIAGALEYDDDGLPSNADKLLSDLVKSKPYLAAQPAAQPPAASSGAALNPARSQSGGVVITQAQFDDYGFRKQFETQNKMTLAQAIRAGRVTIAR